MKILTVLGTRPQFIKSSAISAVLKKYAGVKEVIVDTGQHFDENMSQVFVKELGILKPKYRLNVNRLSHAIMLGRTLIGLESILEKESPDIVLVYGDTNSTLAGALAAKKLNIKLAHIEAGLRSFNMKMPEEINRVLVDRISDILFCPTKKAVENLKKEGFDNLNCRVIRSGDVMKDAAYGWSGLAKEPKFSLPEKYILATVHRSENTDNVDNLNSIFTALNKISKEMSVILPMHPRAKKAVAKHRIKIDFRPKSPVSYLEMLYLLKGCSLVITDSGGLQKEAFFLRKPSVVLRNETEWVELTDKGLAVLTGADSEKIYQNYKKMIRKKFNFDLNLYGDGNASEIIVKELFL